MRNFYAQTLAQRNELETQMLTIIEAHDIAMERGNFSLMRRLERIAEAQRICLAACDRTLNCISRGNIPNMPILTISLN